MNRGRMIILSNRLPITIGRRDDTASLRPSSGGLVTALTPILHQAGGCWVGWAGSECDGCLTELIKEWNETHRYSLHTVPLSAAEQDSFYNGCSNQIIWPLFHGLPGRCRFDSEYWDGYRKANDKFAQSVQGVWRAGDFVWVQDYHLMLAGEALRRRGFQNRIAYFHHIPFPPPDVFEALPWRSQLLQAMMHFDVIGFQTTRDLRNFAAALRRFVPDARISNLGSNLLARTRDLSAMIGHYPVSIDFHEFGAPASEVAAATAASIAETSTGMKVVLGVDRLDYTKGIPQRLKAYRKFLEKHPEWHGRITLLQLVIPSREDIPEYKHLKLDIETTVSEINGEYSRPGWTPVQYFHRRLSREELIGYYRAAHIALITPLRDGMNLVAKEFCAAHTDARGVLVLSEFAGAAEELARGALLVNPNDADGIASALLTALTMDDWEQERRMKAMRSVIRVHDVFEWARSFVRDAAISGTEMTPAAVRASGD